MMRKLKIGLLALGTVLGFAAGFKSLAHGGHHKRIQQKVTQICTEALERALPTPTPENAAPTPNP